ncbi:MAG: DUF3144 domain-containing protein [Hyphomicrobiales bacterium]|nr:DUF3144 domain-containing protein [Hyphomicrobiales bacterium]
MKTTGDQNKTDPISKDMDTKAFLKAADRFIDVANRQNKNIPATDLHMAFLYAAARYNAYVANTIIKVDNHEKFVKYMIEQYTEMLRQHLADEEIAQEAK